MKNNNITFALFLFLFFLNMLSSFSQTSNQLKSLGDDQLKKLNYHSAIQYYETALGIDPGSISIIFKLAEAYRKVYNYKKAEISYHYVWNNNKKEYPEAGFWTAMMMKSNGKYEEAKEIFKEYIKINNLNTNTLTSTSRAKAEIIACDSAMFFINNPKPYQTRTLEKINTTWSEFNPIPIYDSILIFSSLRPNIETKHPIIQSGGYSTKIYQSEYGMFGLRDPYSFDKVINDDEFHTANITFSIDFKRAYFNRCLYIENKLKCDIWTSSFENDQWTNPKKLPEPLNTNKYTNTQPHLAYDSISKSDILYFSSNRPGGIGGLDLWFCIIKDDMPQAPINLGSTINTPGDEITPFYDNKTSTLFFSSNWHYGLGGFDIFSSKGGYSSWSTPINLGYPINSGANDFYYYPHNDEEKYLTSNRVGSTSIKGETCCNDIFIIEKIKTFTEDITDIENDSITPTIKKDIFELLPLSLYFDNDHPNPRSNSPSTRLTYEQTYKNYISQRKKFISEFSKNKHGIEIEKSVKEMNDFFDNYVEANFKKLEILCDFLYQDLKSGSNVTLKVRGFTSPLTSAHYNIILAKRRIASLVNYFKTWNNGELEKYIEFNAENGATFKIIEEASGEALAEKTVSDNPLDRQQSVYSKNASLERRIQILVYESDFKQFVVSDNDSPLLYIYDNLIQIDDYINIDSDSIIIEIKIKNLGSNNLEIFNIISSSDAIKIINKPDILVYNAEKIISIQIIGEIDKNFTENIVVYSNSAEEKSVIYFSNFKTTK